VITRLVAVCVKGIADIDAFARELCHEVVLFRLGRHGHKPTLATSKLLFSIRAVGHFLNAFPLKRVLKDQLRPGAQHILCMAEPLLGRQ
jgi:hypothetical protein